MLSKILLHEHNIRNIRSYFVKEGFYEFTLPILKASLPLEPNIHALKTTWNTPKNSQTLYLSTSPESELKKIMATGITTKCFALTKSFRNLEGSGPHHQPEFLMLEWYRKNANYTKIMDDVKKLILSIKKSLNIFLKKPPSSIISLQDTPKDFSLKWPIISLIDAFTKYAKLNLTEILQDEVLWKEAKKKGYSIEKQTSWSELFDQIFLNEILPHLPANPFFLIDFPARISTLCQPRRNNPNFAERFELFIGRVEIANGNTENTNIKYVKRSFNEEKKRRNQTKKVIPPIDNEFLQALEKMQDTTYAGVGLGVERLSMILSGTTDIKKLYI